MKVILSHWKSTAIGILMIVGSLASFLASVLAYGLPPAEQWAILGAGLTAGVGFLTTADAKPAAVVVVSEPPK